MYSTLPEPKVLTSAEEPVSPVTDADRETQQAQPSNLPAGRGFVPPPPNPNAPGAGIAPPPAGFPSSPQYPPQGQYAGQGYMSPEMGNTSGLGEGYPSPPAAEGWTFGSFVPLGMFSFVNGNSLWGILWWVFWLFSLQLVYIVFVGIAGKKQAWQGRRFDSIEQYQQTMQAWNYWGIVCLIAGVLFWVAVSILYIAVFAAMLAETDFQ